MSYSNSAAFSPRGTVINYKAEPSVGYITLAEIKEFSFTGSKYDLAEITNYESGNFKEWLTTLADSGEVSFSGNYIPGDPSQAGLLSYFKSGTLLAWQVILPNNLGTIVFNAYVSGLDYSFPLDKQAMVTGKLKVTGVINGL